MSQIKIITDAYDLFIRCYVRDIAEFNPRTIRQSYLSIEEGQGIYAVVGNGPETNDVMVHSFIFDKAYHTIRSAEKWIKKNEGVWWGVKTVKFSHDNLIPSIPIKLSDMTQEYISKQADSEITTLAQKADKLWEIADNGAKLSKPCILRFRDNLTTIANKREIKLETKLGKVDIKLLDLGCGLSKPQGYFGIDLKQYGQVDMIHDLNDNIPSPSNSQDIVRANNLLQFIAGKNKARFMEEVYRILKPYGQFTFKVPSTDGRSAFQNPNACSYWNQNTFLHFTGRYQNDCIDFNCKFGVVDMKTIYDNKHKTAEIEGILRAEK